MAKGKILDVTPDVKWIGILDPGLRTFDIIMETKYGTTYNSYFINADKKVIIDTAKEVYKDEYLEKVREVVKFEEIDYIVVNHTEPDHSGSLKHLIPLAKNATVVGSGNAIRYLADIVGFEFKSQVVKDGDTLNLGNRTLRFIAAPNLHWPDTIYSYLEEEKLLFTCDSFGAHYCDERMFDDLVGNFDEAFKYYFDVILKPFSKFMLKAVEKVRQLDIRTICPGHGPILRTYWQKYVDLSEEYALQSITFCEPEKERIFIPYVSAYGYTKKMAEMIAEGIKSVTDVAVDVFDIEKSSHWELDRTITYSTAIIVGSPTLNQNILPQIYTLFSAISPIRDRGKAAASFGSYGWSGEGVGIMDGILTSLKLNVVQPGLRIKFSPSENTFDQLREFGKTFAVKMHQKGEQ